jgi:AAA+ superfamily predicted ATPase
MSQFNFIKDIARYGLENDQSKLVDSLNELIEYSKNTKKLTFALQLQSILKDTVNKQPRTLTRVGGQDYYTKMDEREVGELIFEKLTSSYSFENLVCSDDVKESLNFFMREHSSADMLLNYDLPVSNKILFHGPSGCGKTLASYVLAGELAKPMVVVNLGAIVSSKLGETSKNLAKVFRKATAEDCIIFIDEFDSLGKVRDYSQDHGEMKRVVNTILQLFDYLPSKSIVIAATNQSDMLDDALLRRFDLNIQFDLPNEKRILDLIELTLKNGKFSFDHKEKLPTIVKAAKGLSYYSVQKTLQTAIKRSIFENLSADITNLHAIISTTVWQDLLKEEKKALKKGDHKVSNT